MTPWVQRLLLANLAVFLLSQAMPEVTRQFGLLPVAILFRPWTIVTYMFLHASFFHVFFNMLMLFFFGPRLEERLGSRTFIWFYLTCGIGGAVLSLMTPFAFIVGASGATLGVVLGFARYWPREDIYIGGVLPIQARMLAIFMVLVSLFAGFTGAPDGIAHFAHLGGLVAAWIFLRTWERRRQLRVAHRPVSRPKAPAVQDADAVERWTAIPRERLHEINLEELDNLLRKINALGVKALTHEEREFLDRLANT